MGIVVEYAGRTGKPQWLAPPRLQVELHALRAPTRVRLQARFWLEWDFDETFEMIFAKDNAADDGFNRWTINGVAYPMSNAPTPAAFHLRRASAIAFACAMPATTSIPSISTVTVSN